MLEPEPSKVNTSKRLTQISFLFPSSRARKKKLFLGWIRQNFVWIVYMTMIIQVGINISILTLIPSNMRNEVIYLEMPLTNTISRSQAAPMLASCIMNQIIIGEWYFVRNRFHLQEGDMLGIVGLVILLVTAIGIDGCRLIQAHLRLIDLRRSDWTNNTVINDYCLQTYVALTSDRENVILSPRRHFMDRFQCCGYGKNSISDNSIFFRESNYSNVTQVLIKKPLKCCNSQCQCNTNDETTYTICLSRLMDTLTAIYSSIYEIYIIFVLMSIISIVVFLQYNSQSTRRPTLSSSMTAIP